MDICERHSSSELVVKQQFLNGKWRRSCSEFCSNPVASSEDENGGKGRAALAEEGGLHLAQVFRDYELKLASACGTLKLIKQTIFHTVTQPNWVRYKHIQQQQQR